MDRNIGWHYYLVFIVPSIFMIVIEFLYWPETRNVPLEEVAAIFGVRKPSPHYGKMGNISNFIAQDTDELSQVNLDDLHAQGLEGPKEGIAEEGKNTDESEDAVAQEIENVPNPVRS